MMTGQEAFTKVLKVLYDYQTLIAGILAIGAAAIGAWAVLYSAKLSADILRKQAVENEAKLLTFTCLSLSREFMRLSELARQAESTIHVVISANADVNDATRAKTTLPVPLIISDWQMMSTLPEEVFRRIAQAVTAIERHNFDMARAGGSFGDSNFQRHVRDQATALANVCRALAGELERTLRHPKVSNKRSRT